jgi:squalene-hopene/tetraprenyl-beta-curcumene cyclase
VKRLFSFVLLAVVSAGLALPGRAADKVGPDGKEVQALRDRAIAFLRKSQGSDGSFSPKIAGPGVTALVTAALLRNGLTSDDPMVSKALAYLEKSVKADGGIYDRGLANYTTCVALMAFVEANKGGKYDSVIKHATAFLKKLQHDDPTGKDVKLGGLGYGPDRPRPDLSNTSYFVDALLAAGVPKDDPAIQNALKFISRCQNLPGETNDQPFAKKAKEDDKGGLTYVPMDVDDNPHATGDGGLRSLGAMTYSGLKSFLYAGVKKDDPRVKAAVNWIRHHYTLEENPGMKKAGLFYYYHTFAKAMDALGESQFEDSKGVKHDWRKEVFEALRSRQRAKDGAFVNEGDRTFGEADPNLATAFALLTLSYVQPAGK